MAISIDWPTKVINVPKADTTLVQASPTEIRELDLNVFRIALRELEDDVEGIVELQTHLHNTEVLLGGITYARVINIINGYTVTFEDGQYAVNLVGANSNVGDVVNVNQVSVRSQNSAGLISSPDIEYSSFNGGVTIDVTSEYVGTLFPNGTERQPVNNLADAKLIAEFRGLTRLYIIGDITFGSTEVIDDYIVVGQNGVKSTITLQAGLSTEGCEFKEATINGTLDGNTYVRNCIVEDLTYVEGQILDSVLKGTITLAGNRTTNIINCSDGIAGDGKPIIDMGGTGQPLTVSGYYGEIMLANKTGSDKVSIDLGAGAVEIDETVVDSGSGVDDIFIRGNGTIENRGTASVNVDALNSRDEFDDRVYINTASGVDDTRFPAGTIKNPVQSVAVAKQIADREGINIFSIIGSTTISQTYTGYQFVSPQFSATTINLNSQNITNCVFNNVIITGNGTGKFSASNCQLLSGMTGINATLENCIMSGTFQIATGESLQMDGCTISGSSNVFDMNGNSTISGANVTGMFSISNMTSPTGLVSIAGDFVCNLLASCTNGTALLTGLGILNNLSTIPNVIDKVLPGAVWTSLRTEYNSVTDSFGEIMQTVQRLTGNRVTRSGNIITIYEEDGATTWRQYDLSNGGREVV